MKFRLPGTACVIVLLVYIDVDIKGCLKKKDVDINDKCLPCGRH